MNKQFFEYMKKAAAIIRTYWRWSMFLLRWSAVLVFGVLFGTSLLWRLPMMALAALGCIPLGGILIPGRFQKWFWMVLGVIFIGTYGWIRMPQMNVNQWRPFQFQNPADRTGIELIDDNLNAATAYQQFFEQYNDKPFEYPFGSDVEWRTFSGPWTSTQFPVAAEWLKELSPALNRLIEITAIRQCRFQYPMNLPMLGVQQKRINKMKGWSRSLIRCANLDMASGNSAQAVRKLEAVLAMADHCYQQGTLLDQAAGYFLTQKAAASFNRFAVDYCDDAGQLADIDALLVNHSNPWPYNWPQILESEIALTQSLVGLFYQQNDADRVRISQNIPDAVHQLLGYKMRPFLMQQEMSRVIALGLWFSIPASPDGTARLIEKRFNRLAALAQRGIDLETIVPRNWWEGGLNASALIDWYACQQVAYYYPLKDQDIRHQAATNAARTLIALKKEYLKNHLWPQTLHADTASQPDYLYDPVSRKPFVYALSLQGFVLYSVGANCLDEAGVNDPDSKKDDILYWPKVYGNQDWEN